MGILNERMSDKTVKDLFANYRDVLYMHKISDRDFWNSIDESIKNEIIDEAQRHLDYDIPCIKATSYIEFFKSGNRQVNEKAYFERRYLLGYFVFAECFENKGRFLNDIIDILWAICEETTWSISAHIKHAYRYSHIDIAKEKNILPEEEYCVADLFACETGASLSSVVYMISEVLNDISPMICHRVRKEIKRRIITPFIDTNDMWWMDLRKKTDNWSIWCVSNCLRSILLIEKDDDYALRGIEKAIDIIDNYLHFYENDGACDEGPSYFTKSGLMLYNAVECLYLASEGKLSVYDNQKVKNILSFQANVRMNSERLFNYSDAECKFNIPMQLYMAAKRIGDTTSMALASKGSMGTSSSQVRGYKIEMSDIAHIYSILECYNEILNYNKTAVYKKDVWYNDTQVLISRSDTEINKGMTLGVKGYHNGVNHNHNDVGEFVLYNDGEPIFIDVGVETYTGKTFSDERYTIWTMRSAYHNVPLIGDIEQKAGIEYGATDVKCDITDDRTIISMDIAKAYPERVEKWVRKYDFDKAKKVLTIADDFRLDKEENICFNFMTWKKPEIDDSIIDVCGIKMSFSGIDADIKVEEIRINDPRLLMSWSDKVYRISVKSTEKLTNGKVIFTII